MIDYSTIVNTSGAFPSVVSLNSTGPGNLDGTPYLKSVIDDLWGFSQALMDAGGLTPDAVTESASASQRLQAIRNISGAPGEVVAWMGDNATPATDDIRLLPLNGQGVLVASYPELNTACWVGSGQTGAESAFYRADDAAGTTPNAAGIYLILPDLRGYAIRGLDASGLIDPDGAGRDIGNQQTDGLQRHYHVVESDTGALFANYSPSTFGSGTIGGWGVDVTGLTNNLEAKGAATDPAAATVKLNDDETRMYNVSARWCIRY